MNLEIIASLFLVALVCNWLVKPVGKPDTSVALNRPAEAEVRAERVRLGALWAVVVLAIGWGIVTTIARASELDLSWKLALTLLPLFLGVIVTVGFLYLDNTRFAVTGVSPSYIMAVALLFGLYASLMATEVWQKSERTVALNHTEVSALESTIGIAEGLHPLDRTVRTAANAELRTIDDSPQHPAAPSGKPLQALYAIAADATFFQGNSSANTAFYRAVDSIHDAHAERGALERTRLAPAKLFSLLLFGCLTQLVIAISHAGKGRSLAVAVMLFSVAFSASIGVLELMDETTVTGQTSVPIQLMAPGAGSGICQGSACAAQ
jgi:hypothetical protein